MNEIRFNGGNLAEYCLGNGFETTRLDVDAEVEWEVECAILDTFLRNFFVDEYEADAGYDLDIDWETRYFELTVGDEEIYGYF